MKNVQKNAIFFKLFWYINSFCPLKIKITQFPDAKKRNIYKRFFCVGLSDQQISEIQTGEFDALICAGTLLTGHIRAAAFEEMVRMVKHGIITNH